MHRFLRGLDRLRARARQAEGGFTIIELAVASAIILMGMVTLAYGATVAFVDIGFAKQRQTATSLANETLEIIHALPVDDVKRGLHDQDLADTAGTVDPRITVDNSTSPPTYLYEGEIIPNSPDESVVPLVPHQQTRTVSGTVFTISTYLTHYTEVIDGVTVEHDDIIRASVVASWGNSVRQGVRAEVEVESLLYFPIGCLAPSTHPFSAPCEPAFFATGVQGPGGLLIQGAVGDYVYESATVSLPEHSSELQSEQVISVRGFVRTNGGTIVFGGGVDDANAGRHEYPSAASNNPTDSKDPYEVVSDTRNGTDVFKGTSGGNGFRFKTGSESLETISAVAADTPTPCPSSASSELDLLPCGASRSVQGGALEGWLELSSGQKASLMRAASSNVQIVTSRDREPSTPACTGDGCVRAGVARSLGQIDLIGLPADSSTPPGWDGYLVSLTGYQDSVTAASGTGTSDPLAQISGGTIRYYNGAGYTDMAVPTNGASEPIPAVSFTTPSNEVTVTVQQLGTGGASTLSEPSACSSCVRLRGEANVHSPVLGIVNYVVRSGGTVVADLTITIDLGSIIARTGYASAPEAL